MASDRERLLLLLQLNNIETRILLLQRRRSRVQRRYEQFAQGPPVSPPVEPASSIYSFGAKSESPKFKKCPDDLIYVEKHWELPCVQETQANSPMAGDLHLMGGSDITTTSNVSHEEGGTGITFDISEIAFATDEDSDCSNQEKAGEEEVEKETEAAEEFDDSDPEWGKDALSISELSDSDQLEKYNFNEVHRKARELCADCGKFFYVGKTHTCEYKLKPFSCNVCGKRCTNERALKSHSRIHEEDYRYFCKFCLAPFKTRLDKLAHQRAHIPNEKRYKCPDCAMKFSKLCVRNFHLKKHRGRSSVSCPHCDLVFPGAYFMKRHIVVHTGVKQFVCKLCSRSFNQHGHLKSHMRLHTGEKPYQCQHCDKRFNHNVSLKSHVVRYHKGASDSGPRKHTKKKMELPSARIDINEKDMGNGDTEATGEVLIDQDPKLEAPIKSVKKVWNRLMGRPIGRPKRNAARGETKSIPAVQGKTQDPITAAEPPEEDYLKRDTSRNIESSDCDSVSELAKVYEGKRKEKKSKGVRKSKRNASQRPKIEVAEEDFDSDLDFDLAEGKAKKRRTCLQKTGRVGGRGPSHTVFHRKSYIKTG